MPLKKLTKAEIKEKGLPLRYGDIVEGKMFRNYYLSEKTGKISLYLVDKDNYMKDHTKRLRDRCARHRSFVTRVKLKYGCCKCGYNKCSNALHFNHLNPEDKEFTVGAMMRYSLDKIKNEMRKCEILCANCHAEHSYEEKHHMIGNDRVYKANAEH
jgi:hypothetical protein